ARKEDHRGFIVTEKNLYKLDPKNYKVKKEGIPLASIASISMSTKQDQYIVVHCAPPLRDLVMDLSLGVKGGEKLSEFVAVLRRGCFNCNGGKWIPFSFSDKIVFNNSRPKNADYTLVFESPAAGSPAKSTSRRG